nr:NAD(P)H-quinone oxidoreductase subunit U, chloroplastic [Tanacetum cinerariifolium]
MATTATTSAAASTCICRRHLTSFGRSFSNSYVSFTRKPTVKFVSVRCSGEDVATSTEETEIEVPKGPPSLISALNAERAIRGVPITDIDYYGILGLRKGCAYDQVKVAYDEKLGELMKQGLEQEELTKKLDILKESYKILSSVEDRRLYDWSLARNGNPDRYAWPFEVDITQTVTVNSPDTPPPQEPEDTEPTRLVGYFLLTWIILSIALSIALNR